MLSTDGKRSFAIILYDDPGTTPRINPNLDEITATKILFDAGDRVRMASIQPESLDHTNVYRIDGIAKIS